MTAEIDIQQQCNADGTLQYFKYKYKGSTVKIGIGYTNGKPTKIFIPSFLNLSHQEMLNILMKFLVITNTLTTNWYDRHTLSVQREIAAGLPPHAYTTHWTYTVPPHRKCLIELLSLRYSVFVPTTGPQTYAILHIEYSAAGTGIFTRLLACLLNTVNLGDTDRAEMGQGIIMNEGDTIQCRSGDVSVDGVLATDGYFKGTEFDAQ